MTGRFEGPSFVKSNALIRYLLLVLLVAPLTWQLYSLRNFHPWDFQTATTTVQNQDATIHHLQQLPHVNESILHKVDTWLQPLPAPLDPLYVSLNTDIQSRIAKVTSIFYKEVTPTSRAYEAALLSHREHNRLWGYKHYVQRNDATLGPWSKHSYLLRILITELAKPLSERLDWLFWHDADILLMNDLIPLEAFLPPPTPQWTHVNLLAVNDLQGLNDGVFLLRVCEWSVYFLAAGLSFRQFRPEIALRYDEQGALNHLVREEKFKNNTIHVPQTWFNPYQNFGADEAIPPEWNWQLTWFEPGDLLIHFPGTTKDSRPDIMQDWTDKRMRNLDTYNVLLNETRAYTNISSFWKHDAKNENMRQDHYWRCFNLVAHDVGPKEDDITRSGVKDIEARMAEARSPPWDIERAVKNFEDERVPLKREAYRKAYQEIMNGTKRDDVSVF